MTTRKNTARTATKPSKTKTLKQITSDYLKENKDATISDVYLHVLKNSGVKTNSISVYSFFRNYTKYPSFSSVRETLRTTKNSLFSKKFKTSNGTIIPNRISPKS